VTVRVDIGPHSKSRTTTAAAIPPWDTANLATSSMWRQSGGARPAADLNARQGYLEQYNDHSTYRVRSPQREEGTVRRGGTLSKAIDRVAIDRAARPGGGGQRAADRGGRDAGGRQRRRSEPGPAGGDQRQPLRAAMAVRSERRSPDDPGGRRPLLRLPRRPV